MKRKNTKRRLDLIESHKGRVAALVRAFLRRNPEFCHLREDLTSEGMLKLVDAVDRFIAGKVDSLPTYLRLSIHSGLWDVARSENVIQSPRHCPARRVPGHMGDCADRRSPTADDMGQAIADACLDETDRLIVSMLRSGKTLRGIATELELSGQEVRKRGQAIGQRLGANLC